MKQTNFKVYSYRWIVLFVFMAVVILNQLLWITFAPITSSAVNYYQVSDLSIGLLSMSFMIVYILVSIPASWVIDTYGIRIAVGIGVALTGIFGLMRGLVASNYTLVLLAQIGIAIGQPFILNAITKVAARWFPFKERATAAGLGSLAIYLGIMAGLVLTPYLLLHLGMDGMLLAYGIAAMITAAVFFVLAREHPPTPPCSPDQEVRSLVFDGLGQSLRKKDFILLMLIVFVGLGVFNAIMTWIEEILRPRGFSIVQVGVVGSLMIIGGIIGAVVIPLLSDRYRKRVPFLVLALCGTILGLIGLTIALSYVLLLASSFILGFFLLSAGPIAFQYGAEITYPAPEGTTTGLLLMAGQVSGIIFIFAMDIFRSPSTGSMTPSLLAFIFLLFLSLLICTKLKESKLIRQGS
ncbi:MAG: MFS transporter [Candidatus Nealsonbacteria bacterium CG23_combo_of_CG06-09_8_20_14_all_38_19]|uniref:MFS transporter n=1 Tax=Candidatus Nealsonbacteria bacterium CG23_combo_of_CG06-09_8_20_14_all_38_19 TaxID=1974721 RepID=A0A2G9YXG3_9BACT|nr:MAG: MFS transporter [Candidatus Nealsonbacteria bacterium CG23_combo_of_CG06-09_8_20_14_all_38_19]